MFGIPPTSPSYWFYNRVNDYSYSWAVVVNFWRFAQQSGRGTYVKYWKSLQLGDIVMVDWRSARGYPTHSMVVTKIGTNSNGDFDVYLTYHTRNRLNRSVRYLQHQFPNATWWAFHLSNSF